MLAIAAAAVMLVLAIPLLSVRLGSSDEGNDPASSTTRQAYDLLADGFGPGFNGPLILVAQTGGPADAAALKTLENQLPHVADVTKVTPLASAHGIEVIQVIPGTSPEAKATSGLIATLRNDTIPAAEHGTTLRVYIGGITATYADFATVVAGKMPWFLLAIIGLSFLLLVLAFRSLLIPATAAVMNLLAGAATFGVLTAFFEWGWGTGAFGLGKAGPLEAFLPVVTLAILFGLSMDYQVFLVSRMNEEWAHSRDSRRAVRTGQTETGRVITAAATIMICVFLTFSFLGQRDIAEFGIGLAAAVALDAFILRTVLVPAAMHLFGNANWWLPRWLDRRLPHLAIEPPAGNPNLNSTRPSPRSFDRQVRSLAVTILTPARPPGRAGRDQRAFLLQRAQPAMNGLIDGSLSTLAPIFAVAFATHQPHYAFLAGLATALGAGVSMAFSEALSDTGDLTGRGHPFLRGKITGAGTFFGGILHTLPFLIPAYRRRAGRGTDHDRLRTGGPGLDPVALLRRRLPALIHLHRDRRGDHRQRQRRPRRSQLTPVHVAGHASSQRENHQRPHETVLTPPGGYCNPAAINSPAAGRGTICHQGSRPGRQQCSPAGGPHTPSLPDGGPANTDQETAQWQSTCPAIRTLAAGSCGLTMVTCMSWRTAGRAGPRCC